MSKQQKGLGKGLGALLAALTALVIDALTDQILRIDLFLVKDVHAVSSNILRFRFVTTSTLTGTGLASVNSAGCFLDDFPLTHLMAQGILIGVYIAVATRTSVGGVTLFCTSSFF